MNQVKTVFAFTFKDAIKKKAFIISTAITLIIILILTLLPSLSSSSSSSGEGGAVEYGGYTFYYIDKDNLINGGFDALTNSLVGASVIKGEAGKLDEYKAKTDNDKNLFIINVTKENDLPFITITSKDFMTTVSYDSIVEILSKTYTANALKEHGVDDKTIALAQTQLKYASDYTGEMNLNGYIAGILLTAMIFFAIYYYGYGVAMSVATEKTSRVMETLVVSAKPSRVLIGKCLAMGVIGLLQFAGTIAFAAVCIKAFIPGDFTIMGAPLTFDAFTAESAILLIVYFILGYALYAVMNSVCGASVSKIEDLNSALMPIMFVSIISFYLGYISAATGSEGTISKIATYLPFSSPFIIPFKLINGSYTASEIAISIALLVVSIVIVAYISTRIYSASVLHYGKRQKLVDLYKTKL
jgi:ABC-2 type transport system permease protein